MREICSNWFIELTSNPKRYTVSKGQTMCLYVDCSGPMASVSVFPRILVLERLWWGGTFRYKVDKPRRTQIKIPKKSTILMGYMAFCEYYLYQCVI